MPEISPTSRKWLSIRLAVIYVVFVIFFVCIALRLVNLQVFQNPSLEALAKKQFQKVAGLSTFRLPILDRNGEELAVSVRASSVFARPRLIPRKRETAKLLAKYLGNTKAHWLEKLDAQKSFVWIQRQLGEEAARKLAAQNIPGIFVQPENKRIYPNESLAANVLGFTDIDGKGLAGLEQSLDSQLIPRETNIRWTRDGKGIPSYIEGKPAEQEAEKGIAITIDRHLQHAVEEELEEVKSATSAKAVYAVVMDPFTGEVYAMAQRPTFDPNQPNLSAKENFANRLISHLYEPGSTMKVLMAAEAIQNGLLSPQSPIDCGNGEIVVGNKTIREAEANHRFATLPLEKVIRYSSNVGAVHVAQILGENRVRATLDKFGLTSKTGISLPSEASAAAKPDNFWVPIFLSTVGFGQGVSVTPLQMVAAYAPFANGGYLVRPRILMSEMNGLRNGSVEVRRVLSPHTVQAMRDILISVTEDKHGSGYKAKVAGIHVAGKTGTAQKYEQGMGYDHKRFVASFIGFLPAEQPDLLIGVMVDEPKGTYYGAQVAAPLFKRVAERSLQILDRIPKGTFSQSDKKVEKNQNPVAVPPLSHGDNTMPDLKGMGLRDVMRVLGSNANLLKVSGSGYVEFQSPKPGLPLTPQTSIDLQLSPNS